MTRAIAAVLTAVFVVAMLARARSGNLVRPLGLALLALALGGPAAWPWYFAWGLVLLAATTPFQLGRALPVVLVAGAFLVKANGILVLPLRSAPYVVALYLLIAAVAWYAWSRRRSPPSPNRAVGSASASVLARSSPG